MDIREKMHDDLQKLKQLSIQQDQFKQEYIALQIAIEDYEKCTSPAYIDQNFNVLLYELNKDKLAIEAFKYARKSLMNGLQYYIKNEKEYYRDTYLKRYTYSLRMLTYYDKLAKDELDEHPDVITYLNSQYPICKQFWFEDLYFFSDKFNGIEDVSNQTSDYDDTIIDIETIINNDEHMMLNYYKSNIDAEPSLNDEYTAYQIALHSYRIYSDELFSIRTNIKIDEDFPILDYFNLSLQHLENILTKNITKYEPYIEVYIKRHTFALRILSYYYAKYMKTSYQDIIEAYERVFPYAFKYWREPLVIFSEQFLNLEPFKSKCPHCGQPYDQGVAQGDIMFCSEACSNEALWLTTQFNLLSELSGLNQNQLAQTLRESNMSLNQFTEKLDAINECIDKGIAPSTAIVQSFKNMDTYNTLYNNLKNLNVMRGGKNGFKGFIFEELHATAATVSGTTTKVLGNNQIADFMVLDANGRVTMAQAKAGYKNTYINWSKYDGQTIIVDKGNMELKRAAEQAGLQVIESPITLAQSKKVADIMQLEKKVFEKITGNLQKTAPITSTVVSVGDAALKSARHGGLASAGYSIGSNTVELLYGEKTLAEAGAAIAKDTAIGTASSIGIGVAVQSASIALQAVATTKAGIAIASVASTASTALASTAIGSTVLAGTAAVSSTLAAGSFAVSTAASAAIGSTLAATTAGAAFVAGAPIVLGAAVVGGAVALGKRLFRGY